MKFGKSYSPDHSYLLDLEPAPGCFFKTERPKWSLACYLLILNSEGVITGTIHQSPGSQGKRSRMERLVVIRCESRLSFLSSSCSVSSFVDSVQNGGVLGPFFKGPTVPSTRGQYYITESSWKGELESTFMEGDGRQIAGLWKGPWVMEWGTMKQASLKCTPHTSVSLPIVPRTNSLLFSFM